MSSEMKSYIPTLRAEKSGSRNKDDLRVLMAGVILCVLIIFGQGAYLAIHDRIIAERPFITASVELVHVDDALRPLVLYDADPNQDVRGTWIASVYKADTTRLATRRGQGNYIVADDPARFWAWEAFFDNEQSDPPAIPNEPFYICVRYDVIANDSGVNDAGEYFCSNIYDPMHPSPSITDFIGEIVR